jgi:DNA-binding HxlR family transcriptional regulator
MARIVNNDSEEIAKVLKLLDGKWTIQTLCAMTEGPVRLSQLKRSIPYASKKALTASLRQLEEAKIVVRRDLSSSVLHVEYELADRVREEFIELLRYLADWASILSEALHAS